MATEKHNDEGSDNSRSSDELPNVMRVVGHGYSYEDTTTVYTLGTGAEVFHADLACPHIQDDHPYHTVTGLPLPAVMTSYTAPRRPCNHCTLPIEETAEVVVEQDGLHPDLLKFYSPGDKIVKTRVSVDPDSGEQTVREWSRDAYPNGRSRAKADQ